MRAAILGAGNWGTTFAIHLAGLAHDVVLWEYDRDQADKVQKLRVNERYLPGINLPDTLRITSRIESAVDGVDAIVLAVPAQTCVGVLRMLQGLPWGSIRVVSLIKGIEQGSQRRISEICRDELRSFAKENFAVLSGPTIAFEVARGLPTSAVVASDSEDNAAYLQKQFTGKSFRLYTSDDLPGVEIAGALKNVIALAAGMCDGMSLGANAKGSLVTRGLSEMGRLICAMGGRRSTLAGLSGMGDLVTTCTSLLSRNRTVGERIGRGEDIDSVLRGMTMVAEGVWTARAALGLGQAFGTNLPITEAVCRVLFEDYNPKDAVRELMTRDLKAED